MSETETKKADTKVEAPATAATDANAPAANQQPVELTVQDLGVIRSVMDVATQRGAFRANELEAVGATYNKLDKFLQTIEAQQKAQQGEQTAPVAGTPTAEKK